MLHVNATTIRLFLHVLAATIWVGGQIVLAGLVPTVRTFGPDAPRVVARRFNAIAWSAFAVLVVTGIWNILAVDRRDTAYMVTLMVKLLVVAISAIATLVHIVGRSRKALAIGGAVGGLAAVGALFLGLLLHTGT
ncbi:MAG TPA: hypothetical protein VHN98_12820 [Acidimicrobiales bacterium]|nr:hypothetical protein [Acidimicrobiales bacterium]